MKKIGKLVFTQFVTFLTDFLFYLFIYLFICLYIYLIMKITGRIIFKTTFRCPHDTVIRSKYNIQQITRILVFKFKFLAPRAR